ncbi:MAG TPA: hypothetical protein VEG32_03280 [Clostridia bacterium]|nr:hypothetical protein [Clostridia bacterium]
MDRKTQLVGLIVALAVVITFIHPDVDLANGRAYNQLVPIATITFVAVWLLLIIAARRLSVRPVESLAFTLFGPDLLSLHCSRLC